MSFWVKGALFVGGMAASTLGVKLLTSKTAKKVYTETTAAALRGKECVMKGVIKVREGCGDIVADAKDINEKRAEEEAAEIIDDVTIVEDAAEETPKETDEE
ncbi:hypothetical protein SAMN02910447_02716 [Ruminococcus sp. YE71]|uniref:DUF6110 family protein n=1 Tax=unclassified Ruminococcus TaxID=2608920 RepID=UPI0008892188|nr:MULTISPECIES: DUF6110 family protein [unclassified Ruminococcus]SDA26811.1 hypothetical protein SAMN02910446_02702 [Ruminococcus sp. YE78]SFW44558.1 hypothetical protein SAMN02910447_02716 [Ruminococcus sp. YE71]